MCLSETFDILLIVEYVKMAEKSIISELNV
jgi:hypothetical protein